MGTPAAATEFTIPLVHKPGEDYTVTFLLCADREPYVTWTLLQAASLVDVYEREGTLHLLSIEIVWWSPYSASHLRAVHALEERLGTRFLFRPKQCAAPGAQKGRFLEVPQLQSDITYIGDVDMFATQGHDLIRAHAHTMHSDRTCVSNMFRDWTKRNQLTGCMAVFTQPYYAFLVPYMARDDPRNPIFKCIANDEVMMTHIVTYMSPHQVVAKRIQNHGRTLVGIHISPNRGIGRIVNHGHYNRAQMAVITELLTRPCMSHLLQLDVESNKFVDAILKDAQAVMKSFGEIHGIAPHRGRA